LSGKSTHSDRLNTIRSTYKAHAVMVDTHTADGLKVARDVIKAGSVKAGAAMIVLETALPIKFAETIVEALSVEPDRPAKFEGIEALPKRVVNMPADVAQLKAFIVEKCA
jgi:threonine synthase